MRYIIVNPDGPWIQGDLPAISPEAAVASLEAKLSAATANDVWLVFEAPEGFPSSLKGYSSTDAGALALLEQCYHAEVRNGLAPEQPDLFGGPTP